MLAMGEATAAAAMATAKKLAKEMFVITWPISPSLFLAPSRTFRLLALAV